MVAGLNAIVWERDPRTGEFRFVSDRVHELLGHTPEQWFTDPDLWRRSIHPDDREDVLRLVGQGIEDEQDYALTYRIRAADGRTAGLAAPPGARRPRRGRRPHGSPRGGTSTPASAGSCSAWPARWPRPSSGRRSPTHGRRSRRPCSAACCPARSHGSTGWG